ncbi:MAG TPA: preprotein translocase subunit YajC [Myxococcota bacterium]|jgi:preprotein translocase subunit YajC
MESAAAMWLQAAGPPAWEQPVVMMLFLGVTMYLLLIRPEQKRRKEQEALLKSIAKGDRVVTAGGIRGTVVGVTDDVLTLEVGKGGSVKIEVERARVERKLETAKGEAK